MSVFKIAPATAAGCTTVLKPSENTPLTALKLAELAMEAGFPPGVLNVVPGYGKRAGDALIRHELVDKITFTGSTAVGKYIQANCHEKRLKRVTLELGGKSPFIVCNDADLDSSAFMTNFFVMLNSGQVCFSPSRTFVQEGIYDAFMDKMTKMATADIVGDPFDEKTTRGPQISGVQLDKILGLVKKG